MSDSLSALATYPGLVVPQQQMALGQALIGAGVSGPTPQQSQSSASPLLSLVQALTGNYIQGQGQQAIQQYSVQQLAQRKALSDALMQGTQGGSTGTLSTNSGANNTPPGPPPAQVGSAVPPAYQGPVAAGAAASGLPAPVVASMGAQESGFGQTAPNNPMQITAATAANPGYGMQPISPGAMADPNQAVPWAAQYAAARARSQGADPSTPQGAQLAAQLYNGGGTAGYAGQVMSRAAQPGFQVAMGGNTASDAPLFSGAQAGGLPPQQQPQQPPPDPIASDYQRNMGIALQALQSNDPITQRIGEFAQSKAQADRQIMMNRQTMVGETPGGQYILRDGQGKISTIGGETRLYGSPPTGYSDPTGRQVVAPVGYKPDVVTPPGGNPFVFQPNVGGGGSTSPLPIPGASGGGLPSVPAAGGAPRPPGSMPAPSSNPYAGISDAAQLAQAQASAREKAEPILGEDSQTVNKDQTLIQLGQKFLTHNANVPTGGLRGDVASARGELGNSDVQAMHEIRNQMTIYGLPTGQGLGRLDLPIIQSARDQQPGLNYDLQTNKNIVAAQTARAARDIELRTSRSVWAGSNGGNLAGFDEAWNGYNNNVPSMAVDGKGNITPLASTTPDGRVQPKIGFQQWASARTSPTNGRYLPDAADVPTAAITMLKQNPQFAPQFDKQFGKPGLAASLLGSANVGQ